MVPGHRHGAARATVRPALPHIGTELRKLYADVIPDEMPETLASLVQKLSLDRQRVPRLTNE